MLKTLIISLDTAFVLMLLFINEFIFWCHIVKKSRIQGFVNHFMVLLHQREFIWCPKNEGSRLRIIPQDVKPSLLIEELKLFAFLFHDSGMCFLQEKGHKRVGAIDR